MAPVFIVTLALGAWAALPLAPGWVVSNINVGVLYLFAISSLGVYGVIMGGWASNSKYPFLGALRSAAQMVSYEVSIGFVIVTVIVLAGSMNLQTIVAEQGGGFWNWNVLGGRGLEGLAAGAGDDPDGGDLLRLVAGRDQPPAIRPFRGRVRTRGRLPGRILLDAVPAVHDGRVHEHHPALRADQRALLRRLAGAVPDPLPRLMGPDGREPVRPRLVRGSRSSSSSSCSRW